MNKRFRFGSMLGALLATASSQAQSAAVVLEEAMAQLRSAPSLKLQMTGVEVRGSTTTAIDSTLWLASYGGTTYLDLRESRNGVITRRIVADGMNRWTVDYARNEYSVKRYAVQDGSKGATNQALFKSLPAAFRGAESPVAQLLRDSLGDANVRASEWVAGRPLAELLTSTVDPLVSTRTYVTGPGVTYLHGARTDSRRKSVTFYLETNPVTELREIKRLYVSEISPTGVFLDTMLVVSTNEVPPDGVFNLVLPNGAKPVVGEGGSL